ncbi:MAG: hypothetical protein ACREVW_03730 [Burkholderiales bacterium]
MASLALAGPGAYASGTADVGGPGAGSQQLYNAGKAVYARKLACSSCPHAGARLNADTARSILSNRETFGALDPAEQEAVRAYFQKRLGVSD